MLYLYCTYELNAEGTPEVYTLSAKMLLCKLVAIFFRSFACLHIFLFEFYSASSLSRLFFVRVQNLFLYYVG